MGNGGVIKAITERVSPRIDDGRKIWTTTISGPRESSPSS
jgi:hypothetical protein